MRPVPGEIASVQVHLRTSVANSQLNNDAIHNFQVSRHVETCRRGRDLLQEKKKTNAGNEINTPRQAAAAMWHNVKPYRPRSLAAVSKSKHNGNGIKPIFVFAFLFSTGITTAITFQM